MRHDAVHRRAHAGEAATAHGVVEHGLVAKVATAAAVFPGNVRAQDAEFTGAFPQVVADVALVACRLVVRQHLGFDESNDGVLVPQQVFVQPAWAERDGHVGMVR